MSSSDIVRLSFFSFLLFRSRRSAHMETESSACLFHPHKIKVLVFITMERKRSAESHPVSNECCKDLDISVVQGVHQAPKLTTAEQQEQQQQQEPHQKKKNKVSNKVSNKEENHIQPPASGVETSFLRNLIKAAESGDRIAQYQYGNMFAEGESGLKQNYQKASKWFRLSSNQGHMDATFALGDLYYWGHGVKKNYDKAARLFQVAASQGQDEAQVFLGYLYLTGKGVPQNLNLSFHWVKLSAVQGHPKAQFDLATYYSFGYGCKRNSKEAARWIAQSAVNNHPPAQYLLGVYKLYGEMKRIKQNIPDGLKLIQLAAEQEEASAEFLLGTIHRDGAFGVRQDHQIALRYFETAAEHGCYEAHQALAPLL
jgi:TPR repeat protein